MFEDRDQEIFDHAETIDEQLHYLEGSLDALLELLEAPLAASPDKGIKAFAVLAAARHFRAMAAANTRRVAKLVSGVSA